MEICFQTPPIIQELIFTQWFKCCTLKHAAVAKCRAGHMGHHLHLRVTASRARRQLIIRDAESGHLNVNRWRVPLPHIPHPPISCLLS